MVGRVEATSKGCDVRFVFTNLPGRAKVLYEKVYCARGRMENMIKDHKLYTKSDRTSCHRWEANQFRLFLHTGAYWLRHQLRQAAPRRSLWRKATFETICHAPSRSPGASRSSNPASGSPCRQPIHIGRLSCRWPVGYKPKAPEPSGRCRRINPEHQPPTSLKIRL